MSVFQKGTCVLVNGRSVVYEDSKGQLLTTDICLTPSGSGQSPVPYTNLAESRDTANACEKEFIKGKPLCHLESEFARSQGDEAGSGGGVNSGTTQGRATFLTGSNNVYYEGRPAVRAFDEMVSNEQNTDPAPLVQPSGAEVPAWVETMAATALEAAESARAFTWSLLSDFTGRIEESVVLAEKPPPEDDYEKWREAMDDAPRVPLDAAATSAGRHRVFSHAALADSAALALSVPGDFGDELYLPLCHLAGGMHGLRLDSGECEAQADAALNDPGQAGLVLAPLVPLVSRDAEGAYGGAGDRNRLYIFLDGHLWRELDATGNGKWLEIDLARHGGKDDRNTSGSGYPWLVLPLQVGGHRPEIEVMLTHQTLPWASIEHLGGLAADDPRRLATRCEAGDADAGAEARARRCQRVDAELLERLTRGEAVEPGEPGRDAVIEAIGDCGEETELPRGLTLADNEHAPVLKLYSPFDIAAGLANEANAAFEAWLGEKALTRVGAGIDDRQVRAWLKAEGEDPEAVEAWLERRAEAESEQSQSAEPQSSGDEPESETDHEAGGPRPSSIEAIQEKAEAYMELAALIQGLADQDSEGDYSRRVDADRLDRVLRTEEEREAHERFQAAADRWMSWLEQAEPQGPIRLHDMLADWYQDYDDRHGRGTASEGLAILGEFMRPLLLADTRARFLDAAEAGGLPVLDEALMGEGDNPWLALSPRADAMGQFISDLTLGAVLVPAFRERLFRFTEAAVRLERHGSALLVREVVDLGDVIREKGRPSRLRGTVFAANDPRGGISLRAEQWIVATRSEKQPPPSLLRPVQQLQANRPLVARSTIGLFAAIETMNLIMAHQALQENSSEAFARGERLAASMRLVGLGFQYLKDVLEVGAGFDSKGLPYARRESLQLQRATVIGGSYFFSALGAGLWATSDAGRMREAARQGAVAEAGAYGVRSLGAWIMMAGSLLEGSAGLGKTGITAFQSGLLGRLATVGATQFVLLRAGGWALRLTVGAATGWVGLVIMLAGEILLAAFRREPLERLLDESPFADPAGRRPDREMGAGHGMPMTNPAAYGAPPPGPPLCPHPAETLAEFRQLLMAPRVSAQGITRVNVPMPEPGVSLKDWRLRFDCPLWQPDASRLSVRLWTREGKGYGFVWPDQAPTIGQLDEEIREDGLRLIWTLTLETIDEHKLQSLLRMMSLRVHFDLDVEHGPRLPALGADDSGQVELRLL